MKKIIIATLFFVASYASLPQSAQAQCPMCKLSAESNLKNGGSDGAGLNTGILYMFLAPYLVVGTIGFFWWRGKQRYEVEAQEAEIRRVVDEAGREIA